MPSIKTAFLRANTISNLISSPSTTTTTTKHGPSLGLCTGCLRRRPFSSASQAARPAKEREFKPYRTLPADKPAQLIASTVLVRDPAQVERWRVVNSFPKLLFPLHRSLRNLTFFVSPEFAAWFEEDGAFMQDVLDHVYQNYNAVPTIAAGEEEQKEEEPGTMQRLFKVQSRVAVVDRIPFPGGLGLGAPGVSLAITPYSGSWFLKHARRRPAEGVVNTPLIKINFTLSSHKGGTTDPAIFLRPANTLFVNGRDATMFMDEWSPNTGSGPEHKYVRSHEREHVRSFVFYHTPLDSSITMPLQKLTEPREVLKCMGNILSKLIESPGSKPISASRDLEEGVSAFTKENDMSTGSLAVFALITPKPGDGTDSVPVGASATMLLGQTKSDGPETIGSESHRDLDDIKLAISRGAHLHRVTSGGGGWGQKQGLLSLDPAFGFEGDRTAKEDIDWDMQMPGAHFAPDLARPGDTVKFYGTFVAKAAEQATASKEIQNIAMAHRDTSNSDGSSWAKVDQTNVVWGVIPTTEGADAGSDHSLSEDLITIPHHLGVLSENGLALRARKIRTNDAVHPEVRIQGEQAMRITKLDAPYTVLRYSTPNRRAGNPPQPPGRQKATKGSREQSAPPQLASSEYSFKIPKHEVSKEGQSTIGSFRRKNSRESKGAGKKSPVHFIKTSGPANIRRVASKNMPTSAAGSEADGFRIRKHNTDR